MPENKDLTDEELIQYAVTHSQTERALFSHIHLNRLLRLSGKEATFREGTGMFTSVHWDEMQMVIQEIRKHNPPPDENLRNVLDKGYVRLVDSMGDDLSVVRAARVSHNAEWRTGQDEGKDEALLRYMIKNRHNTPFEHVTMTFEVKAPIFVFRQWHRHRTQSYNELSARYSKLDDEFYVPEIDAIGKQHPTNKQMRITGDDLSDDDVVKIEENVGWQKEHSEDAFRGYELLLKDGWPRELARIHLPVSTYSKMFATMNLHNLFHFLSLRMDAHAQPEIRVYAEAMFNLVKENVAPICSRLWYEHVFTMPTVKSVYAALQDIVIDYENARRQDGKTKIIDLLERLKPHV